jgi:hypothetical protein
MYRAKQPPLTGSLHRPPQPSTLRVVELGPEQQQNRKRRDRADKPISPDEAGVIEWRPWVEDPPESEQPTCRSDDRQPEGVLGAAAEHQRDRRSVRASAAGGELLRHEPGLSCQRRAHRVVFLVEFQPASRPRPLSGPLTGSLPDCPTVDRGPGASHHQTINGTASADIPADIP